jgi:hypothetical protein
MLNAAEPMHETSIGQNCQDWKCCINVNNKIDDITFVDLKRPIDLSKDIHNLSKFQKPY